MGRHPTKLFLAHNDAVNEAGSIGEDSPIVTQRHRIELFNIDCGGTNARKIVDVDVVHRRILTFWPLNYGSQNMTTVCVNHAPATTTGAGAKRSDAVSARVDAADVTHDRRGIREFLPRPEDRELAIRAVDNRTRKKLYRFQFRSQYRPRSQTSWTWFRSQR